MTDPTDNAMMLDLEEYQVICRKKLDEERGNPPICGCPRCKPKKDDPHYLGELYLEGEWEPTPDY